MVCLVFFASFFLQFLGLLAKDPRQLIVCRIFVDVQHEIECVLAVLEQIPALDVVLLWFASASAKAEYSNPALTHNMSC